MKSSGHKQIVKQYFLFSENRLSPIRKKEIEHHLHNCDPCFNSYKRLDRLQFTKELPGVNKVPQSVWHQINAEIDTQLKQHNNFIFPSSMRTIQVFATFIFIILAFGFGYLLGDFQQTPSVDDSINLQIRQSYFDEIQLKWLSDAPPQTIVQAVKQMDVLKGLEEK